LVFSFDFEVEFLFKEVRFSFTILESVFIHAGFKLKVKVLVSVKLEVGLGVDAVSVTDG
jgi:hypothetical protein